MGKRKRLRKAAEENLELDEAALQNQEQERIRNNESDASRREEQQVHFSLSFLY
jgi:hypothetical protein